MSSPHDNLDQLLDDRLRGQNSQVNVPDDDAALVDELLTQLHPTSVSPKKKRLLWQKAQHMAHNRKPKRQPKPPRILQRIATLIIAVGLLGVALIWNQQRINDSQALLAADIAQQRLSDMQLFDNPPQISDAFDFEYGAYTPVSDNIPAASVLDDADAAWVAQYVFFDPALENQLADLQEAITTAHNQGFKIMFTMDGFPEQYDADYHAAYVAFLGDVADAGADAIEIWSEANLDRNFPPDALSEGAYSQLIEDGADTIREANSNTLVISGAPAPTGAEVAFPGQIMNDDNFLLTLQESGALDDVDCVGMHYMEGTVPPLATEGDARDDYYTRYLPVQLQTYRAVVQAQMPICVTSLGYLSNENQTDVPRFFEWANTTSLTEQTNWTREALEWLSLQADVRLAILWHVDVVTNEPGQAGFDLHRN